MAEIVHTEQVREGEKARYPFKSEYEEPTLESYLFVGWKYNGTIYEPNQYASEASNPFGPIIENTDILAMWSQIRVFCIPDKTIIGYEGGQIKIMYYAVTSRVVTSNDVEKQFIPPRVNPIIYNNVTDTEVSGQYRMCTFNVTQNNGDEGRKLRVAATYKGVMSDVVEIYQQSASEVVIPDCDYFHFTYSWENDANGGGTDLDSLTVIYVEDKDGNRVSKTFTGRPVGYGTHCYSVSSIKDGQDDKLCMQHGGDCRTSDAEGVVVCLTNIANTGEVSNLDKIIIKIYGNWYISKSNGNMKINCNAYKSRSETPTFGNDIEVTDMIEIIGEGESASEHHYDKFSPNLQNCETVWQQTRDLTVKARGSQNAGQDIECAGEIYSNVCTVVYRIGGNPSNNKSFIPRNVDNGIDWRDGHHSTNIYQNTAQRISTPIVLETNDTTEHSVNDIYLNYWDVDYNFYDNDEDYVSIYLNKDYNQEIGGSSFSFKITKDKIGQVFNATDTKVFDKFQVTRSSNGRVNVTFKLKSYVGSSRQIAIEFSKYFNDCKPDVHETTGFRIHQGVTS